MAGKSLALLLLLACSTYICLGQTESRELGGKSKPKPLNPSCQEAGKFKKLIGKGNKKVQKAIEKFNKIRDDLDQKSRNINWDAPPVLALTGGATAEIKDDFFLNGGGLRQIVFQPPVGQASVTETGFEDALGFDAGVTAFSPGVTFAPLQSNYIDISFTLPDRATAGMVHGFGCIFTDVEINSKSGLVFYGALGEKIGEVYAPKVKNGEHSFVGGFFEEASVASVRIYFGDNGHPDLTEDNEGDDYDFVAVDDLFFFLSDTEVPTTTFRGFVDSIDSEQIIKNFDNRRNALFPGNKRNINWDAPPVLALTGGASAPIGESFFLNGGGLRQISLFRSSEGENGVVSENAFADITDPTYLDAFTPKVNFAPTKDGKAQQTMDFFLADKTSKGLTHGFAAIFTDVETPNIAGIRYFNDAGVEILNVRAKPGKKGNHQFVGAIFPKPVVKYVIVDNCNNDQLGNVQEDVDGGIDFCATDDWFFFLSETPAS